MDEHGRRGIGERESRLARENRSCDRGSISGSRGRPGQE
jgi:hypothetical protein